MRERPGLLGRAYWRCSTPVLRGYQDGEGRIGERSPGRLDVKKETEDTVAASPIHPLDLLCSTNPQVNTAKERKVQFTIWHGARKHVACLRTIKSLVENMIIGVTKGFLYKMRLVYAHFPINAIPNDDGSHLQIRNFCSSLLSIGSLSRS